MSPSISMRCIPNLFGGTSHFDHCAFFKVQYWVSCYTKSRCCTNSLRNGAPNTNGMLLCPGVSSQKSLDESPFLTWVENNPTKNLDVCERRASLKSDESSMRSILNKIEIANAHTYCSLGGPASTLIWESPCGNDARLQSHSIACGQFMRYHGSTTKLSIRERHRGRGPNNNIQPCPLV